MSGKEEIIFAFICLYIAGVHTLSIICNYEIEKLHVLMEKYYKIKTRKIKKSRN